MPDRSESTINRQLLTWARESAGLTVVAAARKLHVNAARLEEWEKGESEPTINQLGKLADAYKRPLAIFFLSEPPKEAGAPPDFRRFDVSKAPPLSPELRVAIRRARLKRQAALEIADELNEDLPRFSMKAAVSESPEEVATQLRRELGLEDDTQGLDWREHFNRRRSALEDKGILVFQAEKIGLDEMRGFSITERPLPVLVVNIKDVPQARSFSLFHEAAHVVLGNSGLCNFEENGVHNAKQRVEAFCNHVAGATLVPAGALLKSPEAPRSVVQEIPDDVGRSLARRFGVSFEVILRRLVAVGRLPMAYYLKKRDELRRLNSSRRLAKTGFAPPDSMAIATNGRRFTRLVLDAYSEEKIGTADILEYLGVRSKHLESIRSKLESSHAEESTEA
jgi:Zn-dependent peptidase ImmA (M78 family)/DNA-binding XRE family transcriptional regulator